MKSFGMFCLLFGCAAWGQAVNSSASLADHGAIQSFVGAKAGAGSLNSLSSASKGSPDKPLITISGLCDNRADNAAARDCETVITQSQFEVMIDALEPGMRVHARREFAQHYAEVLVMAGEARKMGLDQGPAFEEQMKLARIQILSQALKKAVQTKVAHIPDTDVQDFYDKNKARFEKAELDRLSLPRNRQTLADCANKLADAEKQKCSTEPDQMIKEEADSLRQRAIIGEDFAVLQADAYRVAGITTASPSTSMWVRRISLPPDQALVMDLAPGQVSPVLSDSNGYFIYKVKAKSMVSLDQASEEIKEALRTQRVQDEMRSILNSAPSTINESYFAR